MEKRIFRKKTVLKENQEMIQKSGTYTCFRLMERLLFADYDLKVKILIISL